MENIKNLVKNVRDSGKSPSLETLIQKVAKYEYVSFDVFDTLLKRKINNPTDIFKIMELQNGSKYPDFFAKRIAAEARARKHYSPLEVTLTQIYQYYPNISDVDRSSLAHQEIDLERQVLVANPKLVKLFKYCIERKKKVYIISDMYLPTNFIESVLKINSIVGYQKLYVSSEYSLTKRSGQLFDLYLKENRINPKTAIHIGDSLKSDYKIPRSKGMSAVHLPTIDIEVDKQSTGSISHQYLERFIRFNSLDLTDEYELFGFQKFGPFLWGYVRWLHKQFVANDIKKVFFLSRDGYIMKKAYDLLYSDDREIDDTYLEVSRRSLRVPVLWMDSSLETVLDTISPSKLVSVRSIFDGVGLDIEQYHAVLAKYGLDANSSFDRSTILSDQKLRGLYNEIEPDLVANSKEEYQLLEQYLQQQHLSGRFAIVDIGWAGSMQRFLEQTLDKMKIAHDIFGYYIGVADYYTRNETVHSLNLKGYLFDFKNNESAIDLRSSFVGLFESLFLEQAGSVKKYQQDNTHIFAQRYEYEYLKDGKPTFELLSVEKIQTGAIEFIAKAKRDSIISDIFDYSAKELFSGIQQTGMQPSETDLKLFADFHFYDEGADIRLAAPKSILYYAKHPKDFKTDFLSCRWKIGFMKKLFKGRLPYQKMYELMKTISKG